jgi:tetratricopeptide (TPR) repeat protein
MDVFNEDYNTKKAILDELIAPVFKDTSLVEDIRTYSKEKRVAYQEMKAVFVLSNIDGEAFKKTIWQKGPTEEGRTTYTVREENRVSFSSHKNITTLSELLTSDQADCDTSSFVYMEILERINKDLPVVLLHCPGHVLLRWKFTDGSYMNWETTSGWRSSGTKDKYYADNCTEVVPGTDAFYALFYANRALAEDSLKNYTGAITDYDKAIELDPKNAATYTNRGVLKGEQGNLNEAITDYNKAIALDPKSVLAYYNRGIEKYISFAYCGRALAEDYRKDYAGVIADCNKAIALDPKIEKAYTLRDIAKTKLGESGILGVPFLSPNKTHSITVKFNNGKIDNINDVTLGLGYKGTEKITKISDDGKSFIFTTATGVNYKITPDLTTLTYDTVKLEGKVE